jgi:hypothetical protein
MTSTRPQQPTQYQLLQQQAFGALLPTEPTRKIPDLDVSKQQPEEWSMVQLHWREQNLRNDTDREQWLFHKYKSQPGGHVMIHPHTRETRIYLHDVLSENLYSEWRPGRRLQWCMGCCGTSQRCLPSTNKEIWVILFIVYGWIWANFIYGTIEGMFPKDPAADPIPMSVVWARFASTMYETLAVGGVTWLIYQIPRTYRHCFKCRLLPRRREAQIKLAKSKDRALCTCGPIICCLGTYFSHLRRARLEKCTEYDQTLDPEAATSSYIYDSDLDDPDEFIYDQHLKHAVPPRSKAAFKRPKSTVYIVNVDEPQEEAQGTNKNDTSRYRYDSDGSSTDMDGS